MEEEEDTAAETLEDSAEEAHSGIGATQEADEIEVQADLDKEKRVKKAREEKIPGKEEASAEEVIPGEEIPEADAVAAEEAEALAAADAGEDISSLFY